MKIYYPDYCKNFKCIAKKCRHSCCVGWEISVDCETLERYDGLEGKADIRRHISDGVIRLCADGRCPFLDDSGLCRIISRFGDDYTSVICREHPRFYHRVGDRVECGLGLCCEEAARVVLSSDRYLDFYGREHTASVPDGTDFDTISHRKYIYGILSDGNLSYGEKIDRIKKKYSLEREIHTNDEWREIFCDLEYLDERHRGVFTLGSDTGAYTDIYIRFLAYLIFRHVSVAENHDNLRARLGFCLLLTRILEGYIHKRMDFAALCDMARIISEEIEYSEDNAASLIFEFECEL